jgi:hypothetical protein
MWQDSQKRRFGNAPAKLLETINQKSRPGAAFLHCYYFLIVPTLFFFIKAHRLFGGHQQVVFFLAAYNHVFKFL